jgi:hypothetical protein
MPKIMTEEDLEKECLDLFSNLGYCRVYGPDVSEGGIAEERKYNEVVLVGGCVVLLGELTSLSLIVRLMRRLRRF